MCCSCSTASDRDATLSSTDESLPTDSTARGQAAAVSKATRCNAIHLLEHELPGRQAAADEARGRTLRFLANVDPVDVARALNSLDPATTMAVVVSKTFTTAETMLNARTVRWEQQQPQPRCCLAPLRDGLHHESNA